MPIRAPLAPRLAIGALAAVVLLVQISATRLLSATVHYHATFAILALVMLALAGSASAVYRDRSREAGDPGLSGAARFAGIAGPVIAGTAILYLVVGAIPWPVALWTPIHFLVAGFGFYATFYTCGYAIAWLLTAWPRDIGRVYFADLAGAALGCLAAVPVLSVASPVQVLVAGGLVTALAGLALGGAERRAPRLVAAALAAATLVVFAFPDAVRLRSAKAQDQSLVLHEAWSPLARVTVSPQIPGELEAVRMLSETMPEAEAEAQVRAWAAGWSISGLYEGTIPKTLWIQLDADAGTEIIEQGGTRPLEELEYLQWDATAAAHHLRPGGLKRVFVIGGGGGRDFLTALSFGAAQVDVVELNPQVVYAVQEKFGDFSGRPYTREGVSYRLGDARSELSRSTDRYDLVQMSMIDTWASSMSGALTLSENALYTREAFRAYVRHLTDDGMFTVSRWYSVDHYAETARVLSLMSDALRAEGVAHPETQVAAIYNASTNGTAVSTCIMKRTPFTEAEITALAELCGRTGFKLLWPEVAGVTVDDPMDVRSVLVGDPETIHGGPHNLWPPTDDLPFFFNTARLGTGDVGTPLLFGGLIAVILVASRILVWAPLREVEAARAPSDRVLLRDAIPEATYFLALGASFMGVELGVLQRYIVFLGHPTYALSVVLFALLLSTAIGSLLVGWRPVWARVAFPLLLVGLLFTAFGVPALLEAWHGWALTARVVAATALILPLGVCMGAAFPSGVAALESAGRARLVPWMWAVNGLAGTLASVAGMFLAMQSGYTVLLVVATAGYAVAWAARSRFTAPAAARADRAEAA